MNKGLILISVLIFMNLIMLLVAIGFTADELQWRMSNNQLQQAQVMQTAQFGLKAAYLQLKQQHPGDCQISKYSSYELSIKSASWWHSAKTCHGEVAGQNYYYVIEPLVIDNCLSINGSHAVKYWRITVKAEQAIKNGATAMLQATIVLPIKPTDKCPVSRHQVTSYLRSWRQLRCG
ncbi:MAG: hypothetical protein PVG30_05300 [Gammaproteobacteria bacterium]|jgi:Tfp pilus assembly protein PilX